MPMTDAYDWARANMPQDIMKDSPFSNYQYNYVNDINSGVYNNSSLSLIQYDLSSIYNSSAMTDTRSHFIVFPIVRVVELFDNTTPTPQPIACTPSEFYLTSIKNLNTSLIHQVDLQINGKTVQQLTPFTGIHSCIKIASELSNDDLELYGGTLGMLKMDNPNSMTYQTTPTDNYSTPGIANNYIKGVSQQVDYGDSISQNLNVGNDAIQAKLNINRVLEATENRQNLIAVCNGTNCANELQPTFTIEGGKGVWRDYCIVFVKDLLDAMSGISLTRRLDANLRIYLNTGFCSVSVAANGRMSFNAADSTFTDVCPLMINNPLTTVPIRTNVVRINAGLFVCRAPSYTFNGSNWSGIQSALLSTRYYFTNITLQPTKALEYLSANSAKKVIYKQVLYNTFINISAGGNFSQLIQSGVSNIKNVLIVPFVSANTLSFPAYKSPFDPVGSCSGHPISLINLQVGIGGINQLSSTLYYTWENFVEQMAKYNKQSSSEYGVESGLFSRSFWANNRVYVVACRGTEDDQNTPRNVTISFVNNSQVAIDIMVFVEYEDQLIINCSTGLITK